MAVNYSFFDTILYICIYSFIGWAAEVCYFSVKNKKFINRGFLNLPFNLSYGFVSVVLLNVLPTFNKNYILQYAVTFAVIVVAKSITDLFIENIGKFEIYEYIDEDNISNSIQYAPKLLLAAACLIIYIIVHPVIFAFVTFLPDILVNITAAVLITIIIVDFISTIYVMTTGYKAIGQELNQSNKKATIRFAGKITSLIWSRLEKSYPGIKKDKSEKKNNYTFAKGLCFDKLIWVFLVSSLIGDIIETFYCRIVGGTWMSRSSVLYGPFSFVWGMGAVLLTITLRRLYNKSYIKIFLTGFIVGGAYEYFCSVFTEIVFGTVFWDYSYMPLNIGGRTNVLFCVFWGLLAVVWIRIIYPPMSRQIEKLPVLWGKVITWTILVLMLCNGLITSAAMVRFSERQQYPQPKNIIEEMIDNQFDDEFMQQRWPNMVQIQS